MPIGMGAIIGIGLKLVANREKIAQAWDQIMPVIKLVRENYPAIKDVIDDLIPDRNAPPTDDNAFSVEWLQKSLNDLDEAGLVVDGDYGEATKEAVRIWQQDHPPLVVDGWAGVATQASIHEALEKGDR
jgi:hypothetical protein